MSRSWSSAEKVLLHAKLDPAQLDKPLSQSFHFGSASRLLDPGRVRLMEVDKALADVLQEGQTVVVRGGEDDSAVLCTKDKTYDMKEAETSNSLLLLDGLTWPDAAKEPGQENKRPRTSEEAGDGDNDADSLTPRSVLGVFHTYLELKESKPRMKRLHALLDENRFGGTVEDGQGVTREELSNVIQCSDSELASALSAVEACLVAGREARED